MHHLLTIQYEGVKGGRNALFSYFRNISNDDLFKKVSVFNDTSIADLLVHNVNTYLSWLGNFGLDNVIPFHDTSEVKDLDGIVKLFEQVNFVVGDFLERYKGDYEQQLTKIIAHKSITVTLTPLQLFTHVITHEFHHKGQVLTMSRILGYIPADTDVIRF